MTSPSDEKPTELGPGDQLPADKPPEEPTGSPEEETADQKVERLTQERDKAINDLRSQSIGRAKAQARDDLLQNLATSQTELKDSIDEVRLVNSALAKRLTSGDTEGLPDEIANIQNQTQANQGARTYQQAAKSLEADLYAAAMDEQGQAIFDLHAAPEAVEVRRVWNLGLEKQDLPILSKAVVMASRLSVERLKSQAAAELSKVKADADTEKKRAREASGELDMEVGSGTGGGGKRQTYEDVGDFDIRGKTTREVVAAGDATLDEFYKKKG